MPQVYDDESQECFQYVREFAKRFVHRIIEDAIRQSSKTAWLIHCSESCHQLMPLNLKKLESYICWTPESTQVSPLRNDIALVSEELVDRSMSCNSTETKQRVHIENDELYTLPVDSVENVEQASAAFESICKRPQCLKPKAVHALNVFRYNHQKTFSDFKLFLINLYSSNDDSPKQLGSEHSVFTKYYSAETVANSDNLQDHKKRKTKDENFTLVHFKAEKDLKMVRKCNRMKRSNFLGIRHSFCNIFKLHKKDKDDSEGTCSSSIRNRSLPPIPCQICVSDTSEVSAVDTPEVSAVCACPCEREENQLPVMNKKKASADEFEYDGEYFDDVEYVDSSDCPDFAANIEKVKDYGWYWGPMSSEAAEKLLENERDGSFIVRDSSDDRYIFSLTFKLNACIRHVRIEHGQGNFSFGNYTKFRSHTIVDFIENAVRHSRSGRYLFFLHRRPILGPMRVQLLYPVTRFKHVQSLQHRCRFVILKNIRRDMIASLPLPKSLIEYLSCPDYYTEQKF